MSLPGAPAVRRRSRPARVVVLAAVAVITALLGVGFAVWDAQDRGRHDSTPRLTPGSSVPAVPAGFALRPPG